MSNKLFILVLILLIIAIILAVIRFAPQRADKTTPPQDISRQTSEEKGKLSITKTGPTDQLFSVIKPFIITFSAPLDETTLFIDIEPEATLSAKLDAAKTVLTIEPEQTWAYDTIYTITISKDTSSLGGLTLGEDKKFTFQTIKYKGL